MIAAAKAKSGAVAYGTIGAGQPRAARHEPDRQCADVTMTHVPYKGGGPLVNDAIAGHVPVAIASIALLSPHIKSGALRRSRRPRPSASPQLPDTPTVSELGVPGFDADAWWGLLAPAKTPPEIVARINAAFAAALKDPGVKQTLSESGGLVYRVVLAPRPSAASSKTRSSAGPKWSRTTTSSQSSH